MTERTIQSPDDQDFTPEANVPHEFIVCTTAGLFDDEEDCLLCGVAGCHRSKDDEIHRTAVAA